MDMLQMISSLDYNPPAPLVGHGLWGRSVVMALEMEPVGAWVLDVCHSVTLMMYVPAGKPEERSVRRNRLRRTSTFITWYVGKMWPVWYSDSLVLLYNTCCFILTAACIKCSWLCHVAVFITYHTPCCYLSLNNLINLSWYKLPYLP